ncbi:MAG: cytochrome c [Magnetococcales bacterium]|nr:cytochrome c [Magnetococcales bacterium]
MSPLPPSERMNRLPPALPPRRPSPPARRIRSAALGAGLALLLVPLAPGWAESPSPSAQSPQSAGHKEHYIQSVITLLRLHADAIRQLATQEFKYSRNLARHATALHNTFGLLGPMDWHAAEAAKLQRKTGDGPLFAPDAFDKMADQCQKSMKDLYQASIHHLEGGGKSAEPVLKALEEVQGKCSGCHNLLDGAAPDVWGDKGG